MVAGGGRRKRWSNRESPKWCGDHHPGPKEEKEDTRWQKDSSSSVPCGRFYLISYSQKSKGKE